MIRSLNILSRIFKSIFLKQIPNYAIIYVDGRCNMKCGFCIHAAVDARATHLLLLQNNGDRYLKEQIVYFT